MDDYHRLIQVFGYETGNGRDSILWQNPMCFSHPGGQGGKELDEALGDWKRSKRAFNTDEILQGQWIKVGDHGHSFVAQLHPDGTLTETSLFNRQASWNGSWRLVGSVLRLTVNNYELDIFACKDGNVHSGIEYENGASKPSAYFKVIHASDARDHAF
jgi:hypothetical protein